MRELIISIIRAGWICNYPVSEVINNIQSMTGLSEQESMNAFCELVFISK